MKVLWIARLCRRYLLRAANRLATCVAEWTSEHDRMLYRSMGFASTKHIRMYCCVGNAVKLNYTTSVFGFGSGVARQHKAVRRNVIIHFMAPTLVFLE